MRWTMRIVGGAAVTLNGNACWPPGCEVTGARVPRRLYCLLVYCALPFAAGWFLWKGWRSAVNRGSLGRRLGYGLEQRTDYPVWIHAASVGEVRSLAPLVRSLHRGGVTLLLTVGTPTGLAQARELYRQLLPPPQPGSREFTVTEAPWDLPGAVRRFLRANQPNVGVFVESELWPNLLDTARRAGIPLGLVSARLSDRSLQRYQRWAPRLMRATVRNFTGIAAQTEADRERFVRLGASREAVSVGGSLKAELQLPPETDKLGGVWRARWAPRRPLWIAGSTHSGEETICLAAQRRLLAAAQERHVAAPLLALAPRHPQRFEEVAIELAAAGFAFARSSQPVTADVSRLDVLLIDEMGALLAWYAAGDAAFVGGSLVPAGGHNLLEPAMLAKPVLAGPHDESAPDAARRLRDAGGLTVVKGPGELAAELTQLFADPHLARMRGARARAGAQPEALASRNALELIARLFAARNDSATGLRE
jgi:3-deoxy-D-manno-octulosonic-acid transferase